MKKKYALTDDMIEVTPEPIQGALSVEAAKIQKVEKDRITMNIDKSLKIELQIFCIKNKKAMTEFIEESIKMRLYDIDSK